MNNNIEINVKKGSTDIETIYKNKKSEKYSVVDRYLKEKTKQINKKYDELIDKEVTMNPLIMMYTKLVETFDKELMNLATSDENLNSEILVRDSEVTSPFMKISDKWAESIIAKYHDEETKELRALYDMVADVKAIMDLTNDYDEIINILTKYNIIDKKTLKIKY